MLPKKWQGVIPGWLAGIELIICTVILLISAASEVTSHRVQLNTRASSNGTVMTPDESYTYSGALTLTAVLPKWESQQQPILEIVHTGTGAAEVFLDKDRIGHLEGWNGKTLENVIFTLPQDCTGKTITLEMTKGVGELTPFLCVTDSNSIMEEPIRAYTSGRALPAPVFCMVSLLAVGLFFCGLTEGKYTWPILLLSFAALSQMFYFHVGSLDRNIPPSELYVLEHSLSMANLFALPPFFLLLYMKKYKKIFLPFAVVPALLYYIVAGFSPMVSAFSSIAPRVGEVFYITAAALVVCAILEYRDKNPMFLLLLPGLTLAITDVTTTCLLSRLYSGKRSYYIHFLITQVIRHRPDHPLYWWSTILFRMCILVSVLSLFRSMAARITQMQTLSARESMALEQLAVIQESDEFLRKMRHEIINHYTVLQKLSQAGQWDRLENYLEDLLSDVEAVPTVAYVAHPVINAVLTVMLTRAQKLGIRVEHEVSAPETLPFPDIELCTILMNLLENALDANTLAPNGTEKWLRINIHIRGAHLYIGVENSRFTPINYDEETGLCRTTKEDKAIHGYGLKSVQDIARKYQSELLLEFPDGLFSASTALQIPEKC